MFQFRLCAFDVLFYYNTVPLKCLIQYVAFICIDRLWKLLQSRRVLKIMWGFFFTPMLKMCIDKRSKKSTKFATQGLRMFMVFMKLMISCYTWCTRMSFCILEEKKRAYFRKNKTLIQELKQNRVLRPKIVSESQNIVKQP